MAAERPRPTAWSDGTLEHGFGSPRAAELLSFGARAQQMLHFEAALARVQGRLGLIDPPIAQEIAHGCERVELDLDRLAQRSSEAATPVIALLEQVRAVLSAPAAAMLHLGATSQDAIDTALMLQLRASLEALDHELESLVRDLLDMTRDATTTVVAGRTLLQQAAPLTLGLRTVRWADALSRCLVRVREARNELLVVQFGGVVGALSAFDGRGLEVMDALADELELGRPTLPWHAERDRITELAGVLTGVVDIVAGVAGDLVRAGSTEVAELRETPSGGAQSSAMLHKRNPVHSMKARVAARLAAGHLGVLLPGGDHEFERAAGAWQAEWVAVPAAMVATTGAVEHLGAAIQGLQVDADRIAQNLDLDLGLVRSEALQVALQGPLGHEQARRVAAELCRQAIEADTPLLELAQADPRVTAALGRDGVDELGDGRQVARQVAPLIERALAAIDARLEGPEGP